MIRLVLIDVDGLVDEHDRLRPWAGEALTAIKGFEAGDGAPLEVGWVAEDAAAARAAADLVSSLGARGTAERLGAAAEPPRAPASAGAAPFRQRLVAALGDSAAEGSPEACVLLTASGPHAQCARELGLAVLREDEDFVGWCDAPRALARYATPASDANFALALGAQLAASNGIEEMQVRARTEDTVRGTARKWCALGDSRLGDLAGVHVSLPVDVTVTLDAHGRPSAVSSAEPTSEALAEATAFVESLARAGQIALEPQGLGAGATHQLERRADGRRYLRRRRYSAM